MEGQRESEAVVNSLVERLCWEYCKHCNRPVDSVCGAVVPADESLLADIGGDMNHVHRVSIQLSSGRDIENISVIVKRAPEKVKFLQELFGEEVSADTRRVSFEADALQTLYQICPHSVPKVFLVDPPSNSLIMECLSGYTKLEERLCAGEVEVAMPILQTAMTVLGRLHSSTWLERGVTQKPLLSQFDNRQMKRLMSELLFDRPFDPSDKSNRCHPLLMEEEVRACRTDPAVLDQLKSLRDCFLSQLDCLCHGDFSCDNILVRGGETRVVDMEFAGIGLRAYDVALLLETVIFHLFRVSVEGSLDSVRALWKSLCAGVSSYIEAVGRVCDVRFVEQVCGLIACEQMWRVFGCYEITEFGGCMEPEGKLLSLAKSFLLKSDGNISIVTNIERLLTEHGVIV